VLPPFTDAGLLPPGLHQARWPEFTDRFGHNRHRLAILGGLRQAARALARAKCSRLFVDGSFVTTKPMPKDWDGAWDIAGVDSSLLDPILIDFTPAGRIQQQRKYLADLFPASWVEHGTGLSFLNFFQLDRSGLPKGVVELDLRAGGP
jgi:hypothetical protein